MSERKPKDGEMTITADPAYQPNTGMAPFKGTGKVNGVHFQQIACSFKRDFLGDPYLLFDFRPADIKACAALHKNPRLPGSNKAPHLIGRASIDSEMYHMIAWQSTSYKGLPQIKVTLQNWDDYQKDQDEYRKSQNPMYQPSIPDIPALQNPQPGVDLTQNFKPAETKDDIPF